MGIDGRKCIGWDAVRVVQALVDCSDLRSVLKYRVDSRNGLTRCGSKLKQRGDHWTSTVPTMPASLWPGTRQA